MKLSPPRSLPSPQVDFDGSGSVDPQELLEALDEKRSRITDEVFSIFG